MTRLFVLPGCHYQASPAFTKQPLFTLVCHLLSDLVQYVSGSLPSVCCKRMFTVGKIALLLSS